MPKDPHKVRPSLTDERGEIYNVLEREDLKHVSLITCRKGIRGNHYHKLDHQYLFVLQGSFNYVTKDVNTGERAEYFLEELDLVYTPPGVAHKLVPLEYGEVLQLSTAPRITLEHSDTFPYEVK